MTYRAPIAEIAFTLKQFAGLTAVRDGILLPIPNSLWQWLMIACDQPDPYRQSATIRQ
jgi:hypothetical protein